MFLKKYFDLKNLRNYKNYKNYKKEIFLVLLIKILFLTLIWYCCFRDPLGDHLNDQKMGSYLLSSDSAPAGGTAPAPAVAKSVATEIRCPNALSCPKPSKSVEPTTPAAAPSA